MRMFALVALIAGMIIAVPDRPAHAFDEKAAHAVLSGAVDHFIKPAYQDLHRATTSLASETASLCADPSGKGLVERGTRFDETMHSRLREAITFIDLPEPAASMMANYIGAIAINRAEGLVAATSPKGGAAVVLDARSGRVVSANRLDGASGVAPAGSGFAVSTETGRFVDRTGQRAWDQHIVPVS